MKLVKIYSNKNFKNIEFNEHFNAVIAFIQSDKKDDTHNLGKTSLIRIIDFLLLGRVDKNKDELFSNDLFIGQVFYGEFRLNNGNFLIIKRSVDLLTKISFKLSDKKSTGFITNLEWDNEDIPFDRARILLNNYLSFNVLSRWPYRKSITYFLRSQQDFLDVFKLNKFMGKNKDWKPFVFDLLGFDGDIVSEKLDMEESIVELKRRLSTLKTEAQIDTNEKDRLEGLLEIKISELNETSGYIDKFNFYKEDLKTNKDIVENIDNTLQALNTERYRISFEISRVEQSLSDILDDIEIEKIEILFKEVNLYFPEQLKKDYNDLIEFQKSLTTERKGFLKENLAELKNDFNTINIEIEELESKKSYSLSILTKKDSYDKFKEYQKLLIKTEVEIERIKDKLTAIDNSILLENEIDEKKELIAHQVEKLKTALTERKHSSINKIFNNIIKEILNTNALISLKINTQGNIEYYAEYQNAAALLNTSEAQGTTYKKLLCVAFDLSLLINYSDNSFYNFVYHDGVLEGLDNRIKIRYIHMVKELCIKYDLQYIITLIDSDLPNEELDIFSKNEVCLALNDKDDSGKLFLNSF
ncbi:MAG: DUF2326 domain-containing protein [bacterium]